MNSSPLFNVMPLALIGAMLLVQAVVMILLSAVGAWLAIRFEKWREGRNAKSR